MFIVFEGGDGAGKSTLIRDLGHYLDAKKKPWVLTREPGGSVACEVIRDILLHHQEAKLCPLSETLLFLASRAQNIHEVILPALEKNQIVLCDRFNASTIAYQGVARGLGYDFAKNLCHLTTKHCQPNLTFYVDVSPDIGLARAKKSSGNISGPDWDRFETESLNFHERVRRGFLRQISEDATMHLIDGARSPEAVLGSVIAILEQVMHG